MSGDRGDHCCLVTKIGAKLTLAQFLTKMGDLRNSVILLEIRLFVTLNFVILGSEKV